MEQEKQIHLLLGLSEINLIIESLALQPYKSVANLINKIQVQANPQLQPPQAVEEQKAEEGPFKEIKDSIKPKVMPDVSDVEEEVKQE